MVKKTIKYTDFNGVQREDNFYFNLTKAEIAEMEVSKEGGLGEYIQKITKEQNNKEIMSTFKELILKSYGVKSEDGLRFIKSEKLSEEFAQTEAYSELFIELATNAESASEFINNIVPVMR